MRQGSLCGSQVWLCATPPARIRVSAGVEGQPRGDAVCHDVGVNGHGDVRVVNGDAAEPTKSWLPATSTTKTSRSSNVDAVTEIRLRKLSELFVEHPTPGRRVEAPVTGSGARERPVEKVFCATVGHALQRSPSPTRTRPRGPPGCAG